MLCTATADPLQVWESGGSFQEEASTEPGTAVPGVPCGELEPSSLALLLGTACSGKGLEDDVTGFLLKVWRTGPAKITFSLLIRLPVGPIQIIKLV